MSSTLNSRRAFPDPSWSVNDTLLLFPSTLSVFNSYGVDACCGGHETLAEAARSAGVPLTALLLSVEHAARTDAGDVK